MPTDTTSELNRRNKNTMKEDFEAALHLFLQVEDGSTDLDSPLRRRIYWGLMAVNEELSCLRGLGNVKKMEHINEAQRYSIEAKKTISPSDASLRAQVSLEQHIIEGIKASLSYGTESDMDKVKELKWKAINGLDASLEKLREVDKESHDQVYERAMRWRKTFLR